MADMAEKPLSYDTTMSDVHPEPSQENKTSTTSELPTQSQSTMNMQSTFPTTAHKQYHSLAPSLEDPPHSLPSPTKNKELAILRMARKPSKSTPGTATESLSAMNTTNSSNQMYQSDSSEADSVGPTSKRPRTSISTPASAGGTGASGHEAQEELLRQRLNRRRERNRLAAQRSREKKLATLVELEDKNEGLEEENVKLTKENRALRDRVTELQERIKACERRNRDLEKDKAKRVKLLAVRGVMGRG